MIIEQEKSSVTTNIAKSSSFKIQASAKAFEILSSNIYKNKVKAVIREISCNALDAHTMIGSDAPIEVHLPTYLEKWFSVRDFGPGIPEDKMEDIYTTYFYSDKNDTNDLIGGLGLGTKSPLCLADSFTVTNYRDGYKLVYTCFKNENKEPQISLLSKTESDEPSGLEVKLFVPNYMIEEFEHNSVEVYRFFEKTPNINNEDVASKIQERKMVWIENFCVATDRTVYIVMGNVCYEVPMSYDFNVPGKGLYIKADIGTVNFDPGREYVTLDEKSKDFVKGKISEFKKVVEKIANEELDAIACPFERGRTYYEKYSSFNIDALKKHIQEIPSREYTYRGTLSSCHEKTISYSSGNKKVGYCYSSKGNPCTGKIRHLLSHVGYSSIHMFSAKPEGIPDSMLIDLENYKLPRKQNSRGQITKLMGIVYKISLSKLNTYEKSMAKIVETGEAVDISMVPQEERLVAKYSAKEIEGYSAFDFYKLLNQAKSQGVNIPDQIYMVHYVTYKTKSFKESNCTEICEMIKNKLSHLKNGVRYEYADYDKHLNFLKRIGSSCPVITKNIQFLENIKESRKIDLLYSLLGAKMEERAAYKIEKELRSKHPIFELVDSYNFSTEVANIIKNYIK